MVVQVVHCTTHCIYKGTIHILDIIDLHIDDKFFGDDSQVSCFHKMSIIQQFFNR